MSKQKILDELDKAVREGNDLVLNTGHPAHPAIHNSLLMLDTLRDGIETSKTPEDFVVWLEKPTAKRSWGGLSGRINTQVINLRMHVTFGFDGYLDLTHYGETLYHIHDIRLKIEEAGTI